MTSGYGTVILIVDDDDGHAELIRRALHRSGIDDTTVWLESGELALDYVARRGRRRAQQGDDELLILLDINLGAGMNGIDVLRRLKADPKARQIPVIMVSTSDDPKEIALCRSLGCKAFVTKPLGPAGLAEIKDHLGSRPYRVE